MNDVCAGCGEVHFIDDPVAGDRICSRCGRVQIQNMLSDEPEWRAFKEEGNAEDDARVNTFTDTCVPSSVLSTDFVLNGRSLDSQSLSKMKRLDNPQEAKQARRLISVHSIIQEAANQLDLSSGTVKCAFDLYSKCHTAMCVRGKRSETTVSACLYLACRIMRSYRLLSEIVNVMASDLRKVTRLAQVIITELRLSVPLPTDSDYIRRYCGTMLLPLEVAQTAQKLREAVVAGKYDNVSESALNAVVVLMAARVLEMDEPPSIETMALVTSKSEQNILRVYKAVYLHCDEVLVTVFQTMSSKAIAKVMQLLEPKRL